MKAGKYNIKELFTNKDIEQIIIPEIQRDYVWGEKQVEGLLNSIKEDFDAFNQDDSISNLPIKKELKLAFEEYYRKQNFSCNIGFIYAYNDPEYYRKYFLIDGQQRLTTIYLILLVLASKNENFVEKFKKLYMYSGLPIIDYKVRESSHQFMKNLVQALTSYDEEKTETIITDQNWFYTTYNTDKTISSIICNLKVINKFIDNNNLNNDSFINYIQEYVDFWYFDTNISEQGEELYIYMNARGEQMQDNENLKADLLGKLRVKDGEDRTLTGLKDEWGKRWEDWQHFFWINRDKKSGFNADKGFNEFIACIAGLENNLQTINIIYSKDDFEKDEKGSKNSIAYSDILSRFENNGLEIISKYINGLNYLFNKKNIEAFKNQYNYSDWIEICLGEILKLLNKDSTNWFADTDDTNRGLEHSRMVFMWSILYYLYMTDFECVDNDKVYRVLRLYYVRYNNYNRAVKNIHHNIKELINTDLWDIETSFDEEKLKHHLFRDINKESINEYEQLIWEIEDHPFNIAGRDLGAINCSHIIDFNSELTVDELRCIRDNFYNLFPVINQNEINKVNYNKVINILLFYGDFWVRVSPWYCYNFHFGDWKRTIRNKGIFMAFFNDYKGSDLDSLYESKVVVFDIDFETTDFATQIRWYALQLKETLWRKGLYIVSSHYKIDYNDGYFKNTKMLANTKGDFKGGDPMRLCDMVKTQTPNLIDIA